MTDVHVVNACNRSFYADVMSTYHRKRHDVFVGERGWTSLSKPDGLDVDEYDDDDATYLLLIDGSKVVGGQRLYPTTKPHMITDYFMSLVERPLPRGSRVLECTRYFVVRERRTGRADCRLMAAIQKYCLEEGIVRNYPRGGQRWTLAP